MTLEVITMPLSLIVLGTATPYPQPDRPCSGYLLRADLTQVWIDTGPGTLANLLRHTSPGRLSAIWLSHMHADHSADLLSTYYALAYGDLQPPAPIPVYGPTGWAQRVVGFLGKPTPEFLTTAFEVHELHDGHRIEIEGLHLFSRAVQHNVLAFGLRAEYEGKTIVYSGDTRPCPALDELAAEADLLLCEAGSASRPSDRPQWHHTPEEAGALARRARVGKLLVTHIAPSMIPAEATERAAAAFGGPTLAAHVGGTHGIL